MTIICTHMLSYSLSFFFNNHPITITRVQGNHYHRLVYKGPESKENYYIIKDLETKREVMDFPKCEGG